MKEDEIRKLICEGDEKSYNGRSDRLKLLLSVEHADSYPAPALAIEFFEESRWSWRSIEAS